MSDPASLRRVAEYTGVPAESTILVMPTVQDVQPAAEMALATATSMTATASGDSDVPTYADDGSADSVKFPEPDVVAVSDL